jgi:trehalose/maltose transport system permease protein
MSRTERQKYVRYQEAYTWRLFGSDSGLRLLGKDPQFLRSFGNTLHFSTISVALELTLGLIIALVVNSKFTGRGLMRTAMLVPWAIPTVVSAALWDVIMRGDQTGILNKFLLDIGLISQAKQWLATTGPWMNSIIAIDVWKTAPFMALLLLAGLQTIPSDVYEAADVDGAGKVRQFFSITLPLLRPTIAVALVFRTLDALRAFDVFSVLLDATRPSMASYNYDRLVQGGLEGYSSAIGVVIFALILLFTVTYVRIVRLEQE